MDDVIYRQDAIDAVEESRRLNNHRDGKSACAHENEHRHFLKILRDLPPAGPEQRWIPHSERLPEAVGRYLATTKDRFCKVTTMRFWTGLHWYQLDSTNTVVDKDVLAWMELPQPYTERRQDEQGENNT